MKHASTLYRLLGDEARLRLLRVLARERLNVTELTGVLGLAQSGVSRHLSAFEPLAAASYALHEEAAEIYRRARSAGVTSSTVDVLIVAAAVTNRRPLLTANAVQRRVAAIAGVELA